MVVDGVESDPPVDSSAVVSAEASVLESVGVAEFDEASVLVVVEPDAVAESAEDSWVVSEEAVGAAVVAVGASVVVSSEFASPATLASPPTLEAAFEAELGVADEVKFDVDEPLRDANLAAAVAMAEENRASWS